MIARRRNATGEAQAKQAVFTLLLADGSEHPHQGKLVFLDRNVDTRTGTIMFEAEFPNPDQLLRPGQYARIRALLDTARGALLVPQRAVRELQGAYHVMVVGADGTVAQRLVTTAERVGSLWRIDQGLEAADQVLVDGLQKVRPGMKVVPKTVSIDPAKVEPGKDQKPGDNKPGETKPGDKK